MTSKASRSNGSDATEPGDRKKQKTESKKSGTHHSSRKARSKSKQETRKAEEMSDLQDQLLRLRADFENFRKRTVREKDETYRRASENIILELLPVLDNLELGMKAAEEHGADEAFIQGYRMVADQFMTTLQSFGMKPIDAVGKELDPALHDAVANAPSEEYSEGTIVAETQKGYCLGDRLLRAARVVVSSGPQAPESETSTGDD